MTTPILANNSLLRLKANTTAQIVGFSNPKIAVNLVKQGCLPGSNVKLVRKSLTGSSIYVEFNKIVLALRKNEAAAILVS